MRLFLEYELLSSTYLASAKANWIRLLLDDLQAWKKTEVWKLDLDRAITLLDESFPE